MQSGRAYYNEFDPYAAQWLRNLISEGLIAPGDVDDRSIVDVKADDLRGYTQCHFFAGIGGWSYALRLAGWDDARPCWTGSCPCQPFSVAGKRKGFEDARHLWPIWFDLIQKCRPSVVFGEQVASAAPWLRLVRGDLESVERAVGAIPIEAASAGADHLRDRYWFVADSDGAAIRDEPRRGCGAAGRTGLVRPSMATLGQRGVALGDAHEPGSQGRIIHAERGGERTSGPTSVANAESDGQRWTRQSEAGDRSQIAARGLCSAGDVGLTDGDGRQSGRFATEATRQGDPTVATGGSDIEWVIGADGKARRVGPCVRGLVDGLPGFLAGLRTGCYAEAWQQVRNYGQATSTGPAEVLRAVWERVLSQPAAYEAMGEPAGVRGAEILLPFLCELGCRSEQFGEANSALPSPQELEEAMRSLRFGGSPPSPSLRWQHSAQRAFEYSDALCSLSWLLAQFARAAWEAHCRQNAKAIRLLEVGVPARVGKLRAFGNAINPRPASAFITAYMDFCLERELLQ